MYSFGGNFCKCAVVRVVARLKHCMDTVMRTGEQRASSSAHEYSVKLPDAEAEAEAEAEAASHEATSACELFTQRKSTMLRTLRRGGNQEISLEHSVVDGLHLLYCTYSYRRMGLLIFIYECMHTSLAYLPSK